MPITISVCFFLFCLAAPAADAPVDRATLRGLKAIKLVVDPLPPELVRLGVSQEQLQSQIEDKLGSSIEVDPTTNHFLGLIVRPVLFTRSMYAVTVELAVYQVVHLARDQTIKTVAVTWSTDRSVASKPRQLPALLRTVVGDAAGQFFNAYSLANQ